MSPPHADPGRRAVVLLLAALLTFAAISAASGAVGRTGATTTGTHAIGPVDPVDGADTLTETAPNTTGDPNETVDGTTDTVENTTNDTAGTAGNTTNDTVDAVEDTANGTTGTAGNITNDTTDTVGNATNETVDVVEDATNDTAAVVENTTDTVENATGAVNGTVDEAVETVADTTEEAVESLQSATGPIEGGALLEGATESGTPASAGATGALSSSGTTPTPAAVGASTGRLPGGVGAGGPVPAGVAVGAAIVLAGAAVRAGIGGLASGSLAVAGPRRAARAALSRLTRLFAPLRYSRYDDSDPLAHEGRAEVYEAVEESPGTYLTAVSEETDIPLSTLRHHVRVLEEEDLLAGTTVRGRRRLYPAHAENLELAAALNDEATAPVVDALARVGPASVSDLAEAVGKDASTLTHHLKRLEEDGIVVRERDGRAIVNRLAPGAAAALASVEADADPAETPVGAD